VIISAMFKQVDWAWPNQRWRNVGGYRVKPEIRGGIAFGSMYNPFSLFFFSFIFCCDVRIEKGHCLFIFPSHLLANTHTQLKIKIYS